MAIAWPSALDRTCLTRVFTNMVASPAGRGHSRRKMVVVHTFDHGLTCVPQLMIFNRHCLICLSRQSSKFRCRNDFSPRANLFRAVLRVAGRAPYAGWSVQNGQPALAGPFAALARGPSVALPGAER